MSRACNCKGIVNSWGLPENRVPEVESAPQFFLRTYPQAYPQAGQGVGAGQTGQQPTPPLAKSDRGGMYTPQQKIFAKVKAAI